MKIFFLLIFLFGSIYSFGQIDFKGDSNSSESNSRLYHLIDSSFGLDKNYDFEFRFLTNPQLVTYTSVFIMSYKNNIWSARFFEYNRNRKQKLSETVVEQTKLDSLWKKLVANKVLILPTQDSIKSRMKLFVADTSALDEEEIYQQVHIMDGVTYQFELTNKNKKRSYEYHCPAGYLKHFPNMEEFHRAFTIIALIRKYLGLSLIIC